MPAFPDIVGDDLDDLVDELSGEYDDDSDDEVGARGRRRPQQQKRRNEYEAQDLPIGFAGLTSSSLAAGGTVTTDCPIKTALRPDRLVLSAAAQALDVNDIVIGTVRLNVGSQAVPGNCFSEQAIGTRLKCAVTASPSVFPQVQFTNPTAGAVVIKGGFFGPIKRV